MKTPEKPWGQAIHIYERPLREENITTHFETSREVINETKELITALQIPIDRTVEAMGYKGVKLMTLKPGVRDGQLGATIKQAPDWQMAYARLIELHAPGMDPEESARDLTRTDWNSLQFGLLGFSFKDGVLNLQARYTHSYMDSLSGVQKPEGGRKFTQLKTTDPMSVAGFTLTQDNFLVLGWRGGTNYSDTIHYVPVGSVEPHSEENPLYESQDKENLEELGLTREMWYSHPDSGLVTIVKDIAFNRSYALFQQNTDLSLDELINLWKESACDRAEHRHLVPLPDASRYIKEEIQRKSFDFERANLPLATTSGVNYGAILPQCAIGLLAVYAQRLGIDWARRTEWGLDGLYNLSSGFDLKPSNEH